MPPLNSPAVPSPGLAGIVHAGKAKVAGGFDDLCKEASYEFGNMNATSNSKTELAMGCEPMEMSQPTTTTCAGVCPLISPAKFLSLNLMIVSSWSLKVSAYTF